MNTQEDLPPTVRNKKRYPWLAGCVLLASIAGGLGAYGVWPCGEEQRTIRELPTSDRRAFFDRTLQNLTPVCMRPDAIHLGDFCDREAERVLLFPECDKSCQDLAWKRLPQPMRERPGVEVR